MRRVPGACVNGGLRDLERRPGMSERHANACRGERRNDVHGAIELGRERHDRHALTAARDLLKDRLGVPARESIEKVCRLRAFVIGIDEVALEVRTNDLMALNDRGGNAFLIFLSPKRDEREGRTRVADLQAAAVRVEAQLNRKLERMVSPYVRGRRRVTVGFSLVFFNPLIMPERLVTRLVEEAWECTRIQKMQLAFQNRCRVQEIAMNGDGMASGVVYIDPDGVRRFQAAEVVIIACNGIGTPRLLLNSRSAKFPNGLANSNLYSIELAATNFKAVLCASARRKHSLANTGVDLGSRGSDPILFLGPQAVTAS